MTANYAEPMNGPTLGYATYCDVRGDVVIGLFAHRETAETHAIGLIRECNPAEFVHVDAWKGKSFFRQTDQAYPKLVAILA